MTELEMVNTRVERYNSTIGNLRGYECPKCKNRGDIAKVVTDEMGNAREVHYDCECALVRKSLARLEAKGLANMASRYKLGNFQERENWQKAIAEAARRYVEDPSGWFVIAGQTGSGKTHICTAIAYELIMSGRDVEFMPWRDSVSNIKALTMSDAGAKEKAKYKEAKILFIDDFFKNGAEPGKPNTPPRAEQDIAYELLNYRYNNQLPTIISTERSPEELQMINCAIFERLFEYAGDNFIHIAPDSRKSWRMNRIKTM